MSDWMSRESPIHRAAYGYLAWRESCAHVRLAYREWRAAPAGEGSHAHAAYVAALEGEERAAESYSRALAGTTGQAPWVR